MSTSAEIRAAWDTKIWTNTTITALTTKIYDYDITTQSTKETAKFYYNQEINFITYLVNRTQRIRLMGQVEQKFDVEIRAYKKADTEGVNYNALITQFETIDALIVSQLTGNWNSTVDYYQIQDAVPEVSLITLDGVQVWLGRYTYTGIKNI